MEKELNYKQELSQTTQEAELEQLDSKVAITLNQFEIGMGGVKSEILKAELEVKKAQNEVSKAEANLRKVKKSEPSELVQNFIDAFQAKKQAQLNVVSAQLVVDEYQEIYNFLEERKSVLFT